MSLDVEGWLLVRGFEFSSEVLAFWYSSNAYFCFLLCKRLETTRYENQLMAYSSVRSQNIGTVAQHTVFSDGLLEDLYRRGIYDTWPSLSGDVKSMGDLTNYFLYKCQVLRVGWPLSKWQILSVKPSPFPEWRGNKGWGKNNSRTTLVKQ